MKKVLLFLLCFSFIFLFGCGLINNTSKEITECSINDKGELIITYSDGTKFNGGKIKGNDGVSGKSAYELAKENGYEGTLDNWLDSFKGETGKNAYDLAKEDGFNGTLEEWLETLKGQDGKSAYDLVKENGYDGTLESWLNSFNVTDGKSAYELAKENGYSGTVNAWLDSLKGKDGKSAYDLAKEKGYSGTLDAWLASLNGKSGKSAYEIAKDGGYKGTITEWIKSLEGTDGKSAYELYCEKYNYTDTEDKWLTDLINGDLKAKKQYTVKFVTNTSDSISDQLVNEFDKVTKPQALSKEGWDFKGWYCQDELW